MAQEYWPAEPISPTEAGQSLTALETSVHLRKIGTFLKTGLLLTRPKMALDDPLATRGDVQAMTGIVQTRILPEIEVILSSSGASEAVATKSIEETRRLIVALLAIGVNRY